MTPTAYLTLASSTASWNWTLESNNVRVSGWYFYENTATSPADCLHSPGHRRRMVLGIRFRSFWVGWYSTFSDIHRSLDHSAVHDRCCISYRVISVSLRVRVSHDEVVAEGPIRFPCLGAACFSPVTCFSDRLFAPR